VSPYRLASGGRIDRARQVGFTFDGRRYAGFAGDTLASALLANGVRLFGRSFKYHRPRGLLGAGSEEPNALVSVVRDAGRCTPNVRATQVEIYEGLVAESQNRWPALAFDVMALNDLFAPLMPAAFYYKTFMWPRSAWHRWYEPVIRRAAGLGRAPSAPDPDRYAQRFAHCDVLVVGAGRRASLPRSQRQRPVHGSCFATSSPNLVARSSTSTPRRSTASRPNDGSPLRSRRSRRVRT
jgi:sarcosine oxidase subunit alpha